MGLSALLACEKLTVVNFSLCRLLRLAQVADDIAVVIFLDHISRHLHVANIARWSVFALFIGANSIHAREGSFEAFARLLIIRDDDPAGLLV